MEEIVLNWVTKDEDFCIGTEDCFGAIRSKYRCSRCNALFFENPKSAFLKTRIEKTKKVFCYKCSKEIYHFLTEKVENEFADYGQFG